MSLNANFYRVNFEKEIVVQGKNSTFLSVEAITGTFLPTERLWVSLYIQPQTFVSKFEGWNYAPLAGIPAPPLGTIRYYFKKSDIAKNFTFGPIGFQSIKVGDDVKATSMWRRTLPGEASLGNGPVDGVKFNTVVTGKGIEVVGTESLYYIEVSDTTLSDNSGEAYLIQIGSWEADDNWHVNQANAANVAAGTLKSEVPVIYLLEPPAPNQFDGQNSSDGWPLAAEYNSRVEIGVINPWSSYTAAIGDNPRITYRIDYDGNTNSHLKINFLIVKAIQQPFSWLITPAIFAELNKSNVNYGQKLAQSFIGASHEVDYQEVHLFGYTETDIKTNRTTYQNDYPSSATEIYDDLSSYAVLKTNPKITGNVKLTVDSGGALWLNSIDANQELSDSRFKKFAVSSASTYQRDLYHFLDAGTLPSDILYTLYQKDNQYLNTKRSFSEQYDNFYNYGVEQLISKFYDEDFSFFAPLWLRKELPEFFVIFRLDHPLNPLSYQDATNPEKFNEFFKDARIIKSYDMRESSPLGNYLRKLVDDPRWRERPLQVSYDESVQTTWFGIDYATANIAGKGEFLYDFWKSDNRILDFEETITGGFERNGLISSNLINLEFLFNDDEATPYTINRYFGLYVKENQLAEFEIVPEILGTIAGQTPPPKIGRDGELYSLLPFIQKNPTGVILPVDYYHNPPIGTANTSATPEYTGKTVGKFPLPEMVDDPLRIFYVKDRNGVFKRVNKLTENNYGAIGSPSFKRVTELQLFDESENISDYSGITQITSQIKAELIGSTNSQLVLKISDILQSEKPLADYETIDISLKALNTERRDYYYQLEVISIVGTIVTFDVFVPDYAGATPNTPTEYYATKVVDFASVGTCTIDSYLQFRWSAAGIGGAIVGDTWNIKVFDGNIEYATASNITARHLTFYGEPNYVSYRWRIEANPIGLFPGESWDYPVLDPAGRDYVNTFCNNGTPEQVATSIASCINSFENSIVTAKANGDSVYLRSKTRWEVGNFITLKRNMVPNKSVVKNLGFYENCNVAPMESANTKITGLNTTPNELLLSITTPPTAPTNNTYIGVPLTGGTGIGGVATIVVAGGVITNITVTNPGSGYVVGDILNISAAALSALAPATAITLQSGDILTDLTFVLNNYTEYYAQRYFYFNIVPVASSLWSIEVRSDVDPLLPATTGTSTWYSSSTGSHSQAEFTISWDPTLPSFASMYFLEWWNPYTEQNFIAGRRRTRSTAKVPLVDGQRFYSNRNTSAIGNTTTGSFTIIGVASPNSIYQGAPISGAGIQLGSKVLSINYGVVTISKPATATATGVKLTIGELSILNDIPIDQQWFQIQKDNFSLLQSWDVQGKYVYAPPFIDNNIDIDNATNFSFLQIEKNQSEFYYTMDGRIIAYDTYRPTFGIFSAFPIKTFDVDTYFSDYSYAPTNELFRYYNREELTGSYSPSFLLPPPTFTDIDGELHMNMGENYDLIVFASNTSLTGTYGIMFDVELYDNNDKTWKKADEIGTNIYVNPTPIPLPLGYTEDQVISLKSIQLNTFYPLYFYDVMEVPNDYVVGSALNTTPNELLLSITTSPTTPTNSTYVGVLLTGGTGIGGVATVVIAGGVISSITVTTPGSGYLIGDILSIAAGDLGVGSGATAITLQSGDIVSSGPYNVSNSEPTPAEDQNNKGPQYTAAGTRNFVRKKLHTDANTEGRFIKARITNIKFTTDVGNNLEIPTTFDYTIKLQSSNYYKDTNIQGFAGFQSLTDFLTENDVDQIQLYTQEGSFDKFTYQMLLSEYDRLRENQQKDLAVKSKVVPSILKWVQEGTDARDNYYRLNNSTVFGITNFSPDSEVDFTEPLLLTHEFPYLDNVPKDYPEEALEGSRSYFFQKLSDIAYNNRDWYDLLTTDNTNDWFTKYFVVGYPNEISPKNNLVTKSRDERYTFFKYINGLDLSQTLFRGAKINVIDYDTTVNPKMLINESERFNLYKFAAIARFVAHSNFKEEKPIQIEVIDNQKYKTILIIITIFVQDYRLQAGLGDYSFMYYAEDQLRNSMQNQYPAGYGAYSKFFNNDGFIATLPPIGPDLKYPMEVPYTLNPTQSSIYRDNTTLGTLNTAPDELLLSITTPPTAPTDNTYVGVLLTGGTGLGGVATVVIAGGVITNITVTNPGSGYVVGDILNISAAALGALAPATAITLLPGDVVTAYDYVTATPWALVAEDAPKALETMMPRQLFLGGGRLELDDTKLGGKLWAGSKNSISPEVKMVFQPLKISDGTNPYPNLLSTDYYPIYKDIFPTLDSYRSSMDSYLKGTASYYVFSVPATLIPNINTIDTMTIDGFLSELSISSVLITAPSSAPHTYYAYNSRNTVDDIRLDYLQFDTTTSYSKYSGPIVGPAAAIADYAISYSNLPLPIYPPYNYINPAISFAPASSYNVNQTYNLRGGSLYYTFKKNFLTYANIAKLFNNQDKYVLYRKINDSGSSTMSNPDFHLQFVPFDQIKKLSKYYYKDDTDKPLEYENTPFIGYDLVKTEEQEFEFRHRGMYEPKTLDVINFWARENKEFTSHFQKDFILSNTHINSESPVSGLLRNYFYNKVADTEVLEIARTSAYNSLYPFIGEVAIDYRNMHALNSSWDSNFYRKYGSTTAYTDYPGTAEMQETKVFLGGKAMIVPKTFEFHSFNSDEVKFKVIKPKKSIGTSTIASSTSTQNELLQTKPTLKIVLNLRKRLLRALLEDMLSSSSFDEFAWFNALGISAITYTAADLQVLKTKYLQTNIIPLYSVSQIILYSNAKEGLPIMEISLTEAEKFAAGYRVDQNATVTAIGEYQFEAIKILDTKAANAYSISAVLKRI